MFYFVDEVNILKKKAFVCYSVVPKILFKIEVMLRLTKFVDVN